MRGFKGLALFVLTLFLINIMNVSAKDINIGIEDINVLSKSDAVEVTKPVINDNKVSSEISFDSIDDYVIFEVTLKNNDDVKYSIERITDNNKNKNISISYSYDDKQIKENGKKKITIKFTYNKKVEEDEVLSLDDVKITLDLVKEDGSQAKIVINNPKTYDTIKIYAIIFVVSSALIATNITKKQVKKFLALVTVAFVLLPTFIKANTEEKYEINISFNNAHVNGNSLTYSINIDEELQKQSKTYTVSFDANGGSGLIDPIEYDRDKEYNLPVNSYIRYGYKFVGWNTKKDASGTNYGANETVKNITTKEKVTLYAIWENRTNGTTYEGTNIFNGKDKTVEGDLSNNQNMDYLNTGIQPFTEENREKGFVLSFKISEFDLKRAKDKLDTIFTIVPNAGDISSDNPGVTLRLRNNKWVFEVGNSIEEKKSFTLPINDLINKEFKLIRINHGSSIRLYYTVDNQNLIFLKDMTEIPANDAMISFGATYYNGNTDRYFEGKIDNISFRYDNELSLGSVINNDYDEDFPIVFKLKGKCEFNGENGNITGENCSKYSNEKSIDTNINLFSKENYKKDFEISFDINSYDPTNQDSSNNQQTFMNAKLEVEEYDYPGIVVRKNGNNIYIGVKDGKGKVDSVNINYKSVQNVRVLRKDNIIYYSINGDKYKKLSDMSNFDHTFDSPVYFGSSSIPNSTIQRNVKATLSNMTIRMGKINKSIN